MEALCRGSAPYLERGPVHMHPGPVVVAEPLQVLLCVCGQNRALQLSVYCAVAEEEKRREGTSRDSGAFGANLAAELQSFHKILSGV